MQKEKKLILVPLILVGTLFAYRSVMFGLSYQKWSDAEIGVGSGIYDIATKTDSAINSTIRPILKDLVDMAKRFSLQAKYNSLLIGFEFAVFIMLFGLFIGRLQIDKILIAIGCALGIALFIGLILLKMHGGAFLIP